MIPITQCDIPTSINRKIPMEGGTSIIKCIEIK